MSRSDDHFIARWSRRKRAAKAEPGSDDGGASPSRGRLSATYSQEAQHSEPDVHGTSAAELNEGESLPQGEGESPEPLPRLEDLTPESDLSAFLRKGVPEALKLAALRRMWSLDPAIRDYVGPAEYAWNFNDPGAMAGFGGDAAVRKALPSLSEIASRDPQEPVTSAPAASSADAEAPPQGTADPVGDVRQSADRDRDSSDAMAGASGPKSDPGAAPPPRTAEEPGEARRSPHPPRHGGALPR